MHDTNNEPLNLTNASLDLIKVYEKLKEKNLLHKNVRTITNSNSRVYENFKQHLIEDCTTTQNHTLTTHKYPSLIAQSSLRKSQ